MTKKPNRVRILMAPDGTGEGHVPDTYSGPITVLSGLPRMLRKHELKLVVPLADSTIFEMEKRGEFPRRFNLSPRCVVWDLAEVETWLGERRAAYFAGQAKIAQVVDVHDRQWRPVKEKAK